MLLINSQQEFEDYLKNEDFLEEDIFWLYYMAMQGESLLIYIYISFFIKIRIFNKKL